MNQKPANIDGSDPTPPQGLAAEVVRFAHFLKKRGFRAFPTRTTEALRGIAMLSLLDRSDFMAALRIHFAGSHAEWRRFPDLFEAFWGKPEESVPQEETPPGQHPGRLERMDASGHALELHHLKNEGAPEEEPPCGEPSLYSDAPRWERKDLGALDKKEAERARVALKRMAALFNLERSRRRKRSVRPRELDFSRTLRGSLKTGGLPIALRYRDRKHRLRRLVVLADVSGSMDRYTRLVLPFLMGIRGLGSKAELFVFSTDLARVTEIVRRPDEQEALDRLAFTFPQWSGGTRIGESLHQFNRAEAGRLADRRTVVLILSDGWDLGCGTRLRAEMARLRRKVHRIIWLNPLAGDPRFQPTCEGMAAALPHIDHLLPASDVNHFRAVGRLLSSVLSD